MILWIIAQQTLKKVRILRDVFINNNYHLLGASLENKCSELCIQGVKYNNLLSDAEIKSSFETFFVDHHMNEPEERCDPIKIFLFELFD